MPDHVCRDNRAMFVSECPNTSCRCPARVAAQEDVPPHAGNASDIFAYGRTREGYLAQPTLPVGQVPS